MKEKDIQSLVMLRISEEGVLIFRNNVGTGWQGSKILRGPARCVELDPGDVVIRNARPLHAGLCKGSSDLIGLKTLTITPDMVGQQLAVFTAVEVKRPRGRLTKEQAHFGKTVQEAGGIFLVARSPDDVEGL